MFSCKFAAFVISELYNVVRLYRVVHYLFLSKGKRNPNRSLIDQSVDFNVVSTYVCMYPMFAHVNPGKTVQIIRLVRANEIVFKSHQYAINFRKNILDSKRVVTRRILSYKRISEPRPYEFRIYTGDEKITLPRWQTNGVGPCRA